MPGSLDPGDSKATKSGSRLIKPKFVALTCAYYCEDLTERFLIVTSGSCWQEAGGKVSSMDGGPLSLLGGSVLASNGGLLHQHLVHLIADGTMCGAS